MRARFGGRYGALAHGFGCACHTPALAAASARIAEGLSRRSVLQGVAAAFATLAAAP